MPAEQPQLNQEQIKPPLEKMKAIFGRQGLRTFEKFNALESEMIDVPSPRLEDLLTIPVWAEERKIKNPDFQSNLETTENKALDALIELFKKSPDPNKWSESLKAISKTEGQKIVDLLEKKMMITGEQMRQEKQDFKKKDLTNYFNNLDALHTKLDFLVRNIH